MTNFYITTAISYPNGAPHLGHAYEAILTDVMARFKRLDGYDLMFLTGTDEHGEKMLKTANEEGIPVQALADKNAGHFVEMTKALGISQDRFIRTTEDEHHKASQAIWQKLQEKGDIYLGKYEGWYSVREEGYFTEDELIVDEQGTKYSPNGTEVEWVEEQSYFFRLSNYTDAIIKHIEANPDFVQPESRKNEVLSFLKQEGGLTDLSVSRLKSRLPWGIPVPGDDEHVMYVWLDALTNYITGIGYPDEGCERFQKFWPADYHVIGKDIIRFHAVYWPAFLISAELELPKVIFAHGFINFQGEKMSKSLGNVVSPNDLVDIYGLEQLRYFLMREISHGQDGNFSHEQAVQRMNADLANGIGNLAQRTLSMIYKNCEEQIPQPGDFKPEDEDLLAMAYEKTLPLMRKEFEDFKIHNGLEQVITLARAADGYVDAQAPWTLKKEDPERMKTVLYVLADVIRCIAILMQPVTPEAAGKILDQLKVSEKERAFAHIAKDYALKPGTAIEKPEGVFPRVEMDKQEDAA